MNPQRTAILKFNEIENRERIISHLENLIDKEEDGKGVRKIVKKFEEGYRKNPEVLKKHLHDINSLFSGVISSAYYGLTGDLGPIQELEYGGLGVTLGKMPEGLSFRKRQLWFSELGYNALTKSRIKEDVGWGALIKGFAVGYSKVGGYAFFSAEAEEYACTNVSARDNAFKGIKAKGHSFSGVKAFGTSFGEIKAEENSFMDAEAYCRAFWGTNTVMGGDSFRNVKMSGHSGRDVTIKDRACRNGKILERALEYTELKDEALYGAIVGLKALRGASTENLKEQNFKRRIFVL
ncbi:hypothetical protein K0A97_00520 [Patescibacteria group bacterium]|nr:hypothetical protein [Patescibacteria group bacterium]